MSWIEDWHCVCMKVDGSEGVTVVSEDIREFALSMADVMAASGVVPTASGLLAHDTCFWAFDHTEDADAIQEDLEFCLWVWQKHQKAKR